MKSLRISTIIVVVFAAGLAAGQKVPPGIYGADKWRANPQFDMNTRSFWVVVNQPKTINGKCVQEVVFGGRVTFDSFNIDCSSMPMMHADEEELLLSNKAYSTTSGAVVFITPEGTCIEKQYIMDKANSKLNNREETLSAKECNDVKNNMKDAIIDLARQQMGGENNPQWGKFLKKLHAEFAEVNHHNLGDIGSNNNFVTTGGSNNNFLKPQSGLSGNMGGLKKIDSKPYMDKDGNMVKKVKLQGFGVNDEMVLLEQEESTISMNGQYIAIGNCIFSEEYGKLIVFSGLQCFLKDYTKGDPRAQKLNPQKCKEVQGKIKTLNGNSNYIHGVISDSTSAPPTSSGQTPVIDNQKPQKPQNNQWPQDNQMVQNNQKPQKPQNNQWSQDNQMVQNNQWSQDNQWSQNNQKPQKPQNNQWSQDNQMFQNNQWSQNNQKPQKPQNNQMVQNQWSQNNPMMQQMNQMPQNNLNNQWNNQMTQNNQWAQNNQIAQNNPVAQQLYQVANLLSNVVNQLAQLLGVNGQPNPILANLGSALTNIAGYFNRNGQGSLGNFAY